MLKAEKKSWQQRCLLMKGMLFVRVGNTVFALLTKVSNVADVRQQICWPSSAIQKHASLFNQTYFFIQSNRLLEPTSQIICYSCVLSPLEKVFVLFSAFYLARKNADKHGFSIMNNSVFSVFPCPIWHFASCSHNSPVYVYFFKWAQLWAHLKKSLCYFLLSIWHGKTRINTVFSRK